MEISGGVIESYEVASRVELEVGVVMYSLRAAQLGLSRAVHSRVGVVLSVSRLGSLQQEGNGRPRDVRFATSYIIKDSTNGNYQHTFKS